MLLEAETNKYCPGGNDFGAISNLITWVLDFFLSVVGLANGILCSAACTAHHNAQQISKLVLRDNCQPNIASFSAKSSHHGRRNFSLK